ncbi:anaphase-promoting complex subunit 13-like [Phyllostomus hastatus]|uniref:anaphase-promoting complex subunit 13-like n=1 Tax=Phyllostomus hastatus TaxID=9423 RepID=UPI001E6846CF|nr:anaphase-promoting complex subunit 13-like [Phyllostomus hastatus]
MRKNSEVQRDGRVLDLIDDTCREDKLPHEDGAILLHELPEPEQGSGGTTGAVKERGTPWTNSALQSLHKNIPLPGNVHTTLQCLAAAHTRWSRSPGEQRDTGLAQG